MNHWLHAVGANAIAFVLLFGLPSDAQYNERADFTPSAQITRERLNQILSQGQGVDDEGYLNRPIPTRQVYRAESTPDGIYGHPMTWEPENQILLEVDNGHVTRIDFQLLRSFQKWEESDG